MGDDRLVRGSSIHQSSDEVGADLIAIYREMNQHYGDLHWWPADSPEEVVIGAILVQGVAWNNVVTAIEQLREHGLLGWREIHQANVDVLAPLIRSTVYYRMKAQKLKAFAHHVAVTHQGELQRMLKQPVDRLRNELLGIYGIGEETADDIVLYAAGYPSFVVDAYTRRIFYRLGYVSDGISYAELRGWLMAHLPHDTALFNQYHALLVAVGHRHCRGKTPRCAGCPLQPRCMYGQSTGTMELA